MSTPAMIYLTIAAGSIAEHNGPIDPALFASALAGLQCSVLSAGQPASAEMIDALISLFEAARNNITSIK